MRPNDDLGFELTVHSSVSTGNSCCYSASSAVIGYLAFPVCLWHNGGNADGADGQRADICRRETEGEGDRATVDDAITGRGGHRPGAISGACALDRECGQCVWVYPAVQGLTSAARQVCRTGVCGVRVSLQSVRPAGAWLCSPDCHVLRAALWGHLSDVRQSGRQWATPVRALQAPDGAAHAAGPCGADSVEFREVSARP